MNSETFLQTTIWTIVPILIIALLLSSPASQFLNQKKALGVTTATSTTGISITISDGTSGGGGGNPVKNPADVSFYGLTSPSSLITIEKDGEIVGTVISDSNGIFKTNITVDFGFTTFKIWATDENKIDSKFTTININLNANSTTKIANIFLSPTISGDRAISEPGTSIRIFGSTYPGSSIFIFNNFANPLLEATVPANSEGLWEYIIDTANLTEGVHSYRVNAKINDKLNASANVSEFSKDLEFTIDQILCNGADFNNDGGVNISDFSIMLFYWGPYKNPASLTNICTDLNKDEFVDIFDFSVLMYEWTG